MKHTPPLTDTFIVYHLSSDKEWTFMSDVYRKYALAYAAAELEGPEVLQAFLNLNHDPAKRKELIESLPYAEGVRVSALFLGDFACEQ
jgi:hypothetical protein